LVEVKRTVSDVSKNLEVALKGLSNKVGKVGWFEKSKYQDGTHVAAVAAQNEYGNPSKHIPARPFMRPSIIEKQQEWQDVVANGSKAVINGKAKGEDVFEAIGLKASGDIRKKITQIFEPPLSPVTIAARLARRANKKTIGSLTKPLIDTGILIGTLTNTVENE